jgi:hypothetical protein
MYTFKFKMIPGKDNGNVFRETRVKKRRVLHSDTV